MKKKVLILDESDVADLRGDVQALTDTVSNLREEVSRKNARIRAHNTLLTLGEVCDYLRISRSTAFRWIGAGVLVPLKSGRKNLFPQADIDKVLIKVNAVSSHREPCTYI